MDAGIDAGGWQVFLKRAMLVVMSRQLRPSSQMLVAASIALAISVAMLLVAIFFATSSPTTTLTVFLIALALGTLAAFLAALLAVVGLIKHREHTLGLSLILVASVLLNPLTAFTFLLVLGG